MVLDGYREEYHAGNARFNQTLVRSGTRDKLPMNENMKRVVLCVGVLLLITIAPLFSDSVLVHLYADVSADYEDRAEVQRMVSAMEDGIMRELFDAGHIVFNTMDRTTPMDVASAADTGGEQGAELVVTVELEITRESESFQLQGVGYQTLEVEGEEVYLENEVDEDTFARRSEESREQAAQRTGREIGARVAESL